MKPLFKNILLKPLEKEKATSYGLLLPESAQKNLNKAIKVLEGYIPDNAEPVEIT